MARRVVRFAELDWSAQALLDSAVPGCGATMAPVIGLGMTEERDHAAPVANSHGFSIEWLKLPPGGAVSLHRLQHKQVLAIYHGSVEIAAKAGGTMVHTAAHGSDEGWDSFAMPADCWRSYRNLGEDSAVMLVMTQGDGRKTIEWSPAVVETAAALGRTRDADGFVAPKRFVDRSQR